MPESLPQKPPKSRSFSVRLKKVLILRKSIFFIVKVGSGLLFANLAGMLAVNLGRFVVELLGDTLSYAYYSFGISITNLVLTFVTAVSMAVYPSLKRIDLGDLPHFFSRIHDISSFISILGLLSYAPLCGAVYILFPQYSPLLPYLSFLLLSVAGQVKMQLLCNTYYKTMRLEGRLLVANLWAVVAMVLLGIPLFLLTHDAACIAVVTAITMLIRSWMSERELAGHLGIRKSNGIIFEVIVFAIFAIGTLLPGCMGLVIPFATCLIACFVLALSNNKKRGSD